MSTTIKVKSIDEGLAVVFDRLPQAIRATVQELLLRFERQELAKIQEETWDEGLMRLSLGTIELRRRAGKGFTRKPTRVGVALDYYNVVPKNKRARPEGPAYEWAGHLRRAASRFTRFGKASAVIDPDKNYRGPLRAIFTKPFTDTVLSSVSVRKVIKIRRMEKGIANVAGRWMRDDVLPLVVAPGNLRRPPRSRSSFGDDPVSSGEESF